MIIAIELKDEEGVVKGPHHYLLKCYPLARLERQVYEFLRKRKSLPLSAIWKTFDCHLWEISVVLRRLKEKGLVEELTLTEDAY